MEDSVKPNLSALLAILEAETINSEQVSGHNRGHKRRNESISTDSPSKRQYPDGASHSRQKDTCTFTDEQVLQAKQASSVRENSEAKELALAEKLRLPNIAEDLETAAEILKELGKIYNQRALICDEIKEASNLYVKASALFNSAKIRTKEEKLQREINDAMAENEYDFLKLTGYKCYTIPLKSADELKRGILRLRSSFAERTETVWQEAKQNYDIDDKDRVRTRQEKTIIENTRTLCHEIAEGMIRFIRSVLEKCYRVLGPAPHTFVVVGLGSLAREEMTPYSDLEFMILVENEETGMQYFRNVTNLFHLFVLNLGETPLPAVAINTLNDFDSKSGNWFFDHVTVNGFCLDGAMPWACKTPLGRPDRLSKAGIELIQTPTSMAKYLAVDASLKEGYHLASILRTVTFIDGSNELLNHFLQLATEAGNYSDMKQYGLERLQSDMEEYADKETLNGRTTESVLQNVKKEIYRLPTIITNNIKLIFNLNSMVPWDILEEMKARFLITRKGCHNLQMPVTIAVLLRIMTYTKNGGQKEHICFLKRNFPESQNRKMYFPDCLDLIFRYYFSILPLVQCLGEDTGKSEISLSVFSSLLTCNSFYERNYIVQGDIFHKLLKYKDSTECFKKALDCSKSKIINSQLLYRVGRNCKALGDDSDALTHFQQSLDINKQVHGDSNNPSVAVDLRAMSEVFNKRGEYDKALKYIQESLQMSKQIHGDDSHYSVAASLNLIALLYFNRGDYCNALTHFRQSLQMCRQIDGDNAHECVAALYINLALVYAAKGKYDKALSYHQQSLQMYMQIYGDAAHCNVARSLNDIGRVYDSKYEFDKALTYFNSSLRMRKKVHGDDAHPDVAESLNNIGSVYLEQEDYDRALTYLSQASQMFTQIHGDGPHPSLVTSLNNVGEAYSGLEDYDIAKTYLQRALQMAKQIYGDTHPSLAIFLNNIGEVYREQCDYDDALTYLQQALQMVRQIHGNGAHPDVAGKLNNIGEIYVFQHDYDKALTYFQQALRMRKQIHNDRPHFIVAYILRNIGEVYRRKLDFDNALSYHQQALRMRRQVWGDGAHSYVCNSLKDISAVYDAQGDSDNALIYHQQALEMDRQL